MEAQHVALITPHYHIGIVVQDVVESMAQFSSALGLTWGAQMLNGDERLQLHHGELIQRRGNLRGRLHGAVYSLEGPPYLELIQQRPGTVWSETGLHHIGMWVDDVADESARLDALGIPLEAVASVEDDGTWRGGCYHRNVDGIRLELIDIARSGPKLARYLSGGAYR